MRKQKPHMNVHPLVSTHVHMHTHMHTRTLPFCFTRIQTHTHARTLWASLSDLLALMSAHILKVCDVTHSHLDITHL